MMPPVTLRLKASLGLGQTHNTGHYADAAAAIRRQNLWTAAGKNVSAIPVSVEIREKSEGMRKSTEN